MRNRIARNVAAHRVRNVVAAMAAWAAASVFASAQPSEPPAAAGTDSLLRRIEQMIGAAQCTDDAECRVAGLGARACGGAEDYRAWSTRHTRAEALEPWLHRYADERKRWHEKLGLSSTCEVRPAPGTRCERSGRAMGRCVLDPAASGQR